MVCGEGEGEGGSLNEVMAARCFGIIAGKNSIPAVVIYHVHQSCALRGRQTDRQETRREISVCVKERMKE